MSRNIKHRAKVTGGSHWIEGYYVRHETRQPAIGDDLTDGEIKDYIVKDGFADWNMPRNLEFREVNPHSVHELIWTEGNKSLWNGDIIKVDEPAYKDMIGIIRYEEDSGSYVIDWYKGENLTDYNKELLEYSHLDSFVLGTLNVIDNWYRRNYTELF